MARILVRDDVVVSPDTRLAEIDGWDSDKTVRAFLELHRLLGGLGQPNPQVTLDRVDTVATLVRLAHEASRGEDHEHITRSSDQIDILGFDHFESLGVDCEFGVFQQSVGIMRPHLLRFSGFLGNGPEKLARLTAALEDDFVDIARLELLEMRVPDKEWNGVAKEYRIVNTRYGWVGHTGMMVERFGRAEAQAQLRHFAEALAFMRDRLLRDLSDGGKVWIWKSEQPSKLGEVEALISALQRHGKNRLLWVRTADAPYKPGMVFEIRPEFYWGYIGRSADPWAGSWSGPDDWRQLVDSACTLLPPLQVEPACAARDVFSPEDLGDALALLSEVASEELACPRLVLTQEMTPADVAGWDSLKHIGIVFTLERRLGRRFSPQDLDRVVTMADFADIIHCARLPVAKHSGTSP